MNANPTKPPKRILIYGVTGSGKSTLAQRVAKISGLPCHLVDEIAWRPNWTPVPDEEQRQIFAEITSGPEWILDSAYGKWLDLALDQCDLIIGLDFPRTLSLSRLISRTLRRVVDRTPVCNDNQESLRMVFSHDSIILWHFRSFSRKRARMRSWAAKEPDRCLLFDHPRALERWLQEEAAGLLTSSKVS